MDDEQINVTIAEALRRGGKKPSAAKNSNAEVRLLPSPSDPLAVAREFIEEYFTPNGVLTLHYWRSGWWEWQTAHWKEIDDRAIRAKLYKYTEHALYIFFDKKEGPKSIPWSPTRRKISDLADALAAICILDSDRDQPCWLGDRSEVGIIVSVANGLLDVERKKLLPHSPLFFNQTSVPFNYDPDTPEPRRWLDFLGELWPDDTNAIDVLGEWFGYVVSGRTDLHKILLMVGPTRGGKGAIARVLTDMVGRKNVAGPTLNSLGGEFGLAPLIGKTLAVISDARFAGRDASVVVERLLSISGEDTLTVNRKYREQWTGKLPSRLHVLSNELPKLGDASTAIVGRIVLLLTTRSWLGHEDHSLELALRSELTGILNWALAGLHRLAATNGNCFTRLPAADEAIVAMRDLASPVAAFVRDRCVINPKAEVGCDDLYAKYRTWAEDNGHHRMAKTLFGRDLRAAVPSIRVERPRGDEDEGTKRPRKYIGIGWSDGVDGHLRNCVDRMDQPAGPHGPHNFVSDHEHDTEGARRVCEHCGLTKRPDDPILECFVDGEQHQLHRGCQKVWFEADPDGWSFNAERP